MTAVTSAMNLSRATGTVSDLEFQMQQLATYRSDLTTQGQEAAAVGDQQTLEQLQTLDKEAESKIKQLETQYKMETTQLESIKKMLDESIKRGFTYGA